MFIKNINCSLSAIKNKRIPCQFYILCAKNIHYKLIITWLPLIHVLLEFQVLSNYSCKRKKPWLDYIIFLSTRFVFILIMNFITTLHIKYITFVLLLYCFYCFCHSFQRLTSPHYYQWIINEQFPFKTVNFDRVIYRNSNS